MKQAGSELCQAQFKLELAKPDIACSLHGRPVGAELGLYLVKLLFQEEDLRPLI